MIRKSFLEKNSRGNIKMLLVIYAEKEECEAQRNRKSFIWTVSLKK